MSLQNSGAIIIEGHVQGLSNTRSLGEAGIPVYVVDKTDCIARYSRYCKNFFRCPDFSTDEFVSFLIELADRENIRDWVLIPSNDHAVYTLSKHKQRLEKYYRVITPSLDIIEKIYDKSRLLTIAQEHGIPVPRTTYFKGLDVSKSDLQFPVLTKGRFGLSFYKTMGKKAFLAYSFTELKTQLEEINTRYEIGKTFTQELIPFDGTNKTVSFTAFCIDGEIKTHWAGVKLREHPIRFGTATFARSEYIEECYKQSEPLLRALNYSGVCEVEYLKDPRDNQYKLIEINARTWLWVGLAKACGVDYAKIIYDYSNGNTIIYPDSYTKGINWINPISDLVFSMLAIVKRKLSPKIYFKSLLHEKKINALFIRGDVRPGLMYFAKLFSFLGGR